MFDREEIARAAALRAAWEAGSSARSWTASPSRARSTARCSGLPLQRVYTAEDVADLRQDDLGLPGQYPVHARPLSHDVPRAASGRCARSRASAPARTPTAASAT